MKQHKFFALLLLCSSAFLASCDDFLEQEPQDFGDETAYFKSASDLELSVNYFYSMLPKMKANNTGVYSEDNTSDNQMGTSAATLFYQGDKRTVQQASSDWDFDDLRGINFFLNTAEERIAAGSVSGTTELVNHYLGEGYFFRAYFHYKLLRNFGDAPIITEMLPDDAYTLAQASTRRPRNEVARFILEDLDKAIELMQAEAPASGHLCKDAALTFKARVALFEATWERYHAGTCFVPGNSKWVGASYNPDFAFPSGSAEAEVNYFLDQAIDAAGQVADARTLDTDYQGMFNNTGTFANDDEVILARYYKTNVITHSCSNYLGRTGGGTGLTRALVNTYLTENGLPIYADGNTQYKGDRQPYDELANRDHRLQLSCKGGGVQLSETDPADTLQSFVPQVQLTGAESSTTGYHILKWVSTEDGQDVYTACTTANPIFRAAEAYLTYMEAYYERHHTLDSRCDAYWRALRTRAGVDPDYTKTIAATDLSKENDLGVYSHGALVDATLYNIRRERRCEFVAEGLRLDDLKRWRSLDNMQNYQPEGMNMWEYMYTLYDAGTIGEGVVSQSGISTYLRPLQKTATGSAYNGYNFPKQHYLEPIPISEFLLTKDASGKSTIYQNPGWPSEADGTADYSYDCD